MKDSQSRIAVCNQKGSIGKSTFTGYLPAIGISIPIVDWRGGRPDRRKPPIPTVATSKTPGMKIRKARSRVIYMALRIFISGDKFPTGGNRRYIQTISGYSRVTAQL